MLYALGNTYTYTVTTYTFLQGSGSVRVPNITKSAQILLKYLLQEAKSAAIMDSFKKMVPQTATVIRSGKTDVVSAEMLTIGDLIMIKGGDKMPADVRIFKCSGFKV